jgi:hypothetical protein
MPAPTLPMHRPGASYPVKYGHNGDGDLEVTITLPELRPRKLWLSDDDDVVLALRDTDLNEVKVTYTATAYEYNDLFEGEPIAVPVEAVPMFESFRTAFNASRDA